MQVQAPFHVNQGSATDSMLQRSSLKIIHQKKRKSNIDTSFFPISICHKYPPIICPWKLVQNLSCYVDVWQKRSQTTAWWRCHTRGEWPSSLNLTRLEATKPLHRPRAIRRHGVLFSLPRATYLGSSFNKYVLSIYFAKGTVLTVSLAPSLVKWRGWLIEPEGPSDMESFGLITLAISYTSSLNGWYR